jgi:CRISPR/Cas system CMR-associated protein Cmr5 small subunit
MSIVHRERQDAEWAIKTVRELAKKSNKKELLSQIRKLPSHIQSSGLAQTLLFYHSKSQDLARKLAHELLGTDNVTDAVHKLVQDTATFRTKTRRALTIAQWLKRVAEVELEEDGREKGTTSRGGQT